MQIINTITYKIDIKFVISFKEIFKLLPLNTPIKTPLKQYKNRLNIPNIIYLGITIFFLYA